MSGPNIPQHAIFLDIIIGKKGEITTPNCLKITYINLKTHYKPIKTLKTP